MRLVRLQMLSPSHKMVGVSSTQCLEISYAIVRLQTSKTALRLSASS